MTFLYLDVQFLRRISTCSAINYNQHRPPRVMQLVIHTGKQKQKKYQVDNYIYYDYKALVWQKYLNFYHGSYELRFPVFEDAKKDFLLFVRLFVCLSCFSRAFTGKRLDGI